MRTFMLLDKPGGYYAIDVQWYRLNAPSSLLQIISKLLIQQLLSH